MSDNDEYCTRVCGCRFAYIPRKAANYINKRPFPTKVSVGSGGMARQVEACEDVGRQDIQREVEGGKTEIVEMKDRCLRTRKSVFCSSSWRVLRLFSHIFKRTFDSMPHPGLKL